MTALGPIASPFHERGPAGGTTLLILHELYVSVTGRSFAETPGIPHEVGSAGVGSIVDVLTAQSAAGLARQTRVNAELGWQVARAQLALALGRLSGTQPLTNDSPLP